ncbi:MAG TPA: hypothetical protein PK829_13130, partial [Promineifilum sp.]|nr:hypothetical protein [Promineifilum sp.]
TSATLLSAVLADHVGRRLKGALHPDLADALALTRSRLDRVAAALRAVPDIPAQITAGEFGPLHGWLRENIYRHGSKFTANELIARVCGGPLSIDPYVAYLRDKFA